MNFTDNPYYNPESCGLEILASVDTAGSYEFDIFVVWLKKDDNTLWWDSDSGCSCPIPFEGTAHDLQPITKDNFSSFEDRLVNHYNITSSQIEDIRVKVKNHLK